MDREAGGGDRGGPSEPMSRVAMALVLPREWHPVVLPARHPSPLSPSRGHDRSPCRQWRVARPTPQPPCAKAVCGETEAGTIPSTGSGGWGGPHINPLVSPTTPQKAVGGKKDRSFFLFTDLLVCTTLKRKSGSLRRSSMSL